MGKDSLPVEKHRPLQWATNAELIEELADRPHFNFVIAHLDTSKPQCYVNGAPHFSSYANMKCQDRNMMESLIDDLVDHVSGTIEEIEDED